jgi:enediyne biosynthesis protein E4
VSRLILAACRPESTLPAVLAAVAVFSAASPAAAQFVDVTPPNLADAGRAWGVVFTDFDGDGEPDIYFQNTDIAPSRLLLHDTGDTFVDAPALPIPWALDPSVADYDEDGDLDLYLSFPGSTNKLLRNDGAGTFSLATFAPLDDGGQSRCSGWADYDLDGDLDVYLANILAGENKLLRNDGRVEFTDVTTAAISNPNPTEGTAWGDYDNDGDPDLFVQGPWSNPNQLLRNDGAAGFTDVASGILLGTSKSGRGAAWADYDNDGDLDLFLANEYTNQSQLLRNDGADSFVDVSGGVLDQGGQAFGCGWADYDNDGWLDLYVAMYGEPILKPNKLFHNEGDGTFTDVAVPGMTDSSQTLAAAWADYDGDGDLDLYCADYEMPNRLYRNDLANGNHWLHVDLVGATSNTFGVGARITLQAGGMQQIREVGGDMGYMSRGSLTAEFGLGAATTVDALTVRWPTGAMQVVPVAAVDQRITVTETSPATGAPAIADAGGPRFLGGTPNPFRDATSLRYVLPAAGPVRLTVHDVAGRRVAVLEDGVREAGGHVVAWDGLVGGKRAGAGVYFVRLTAGRTVRTGRVTVLR